MGLSCSAFSHSSFVIVVPPGGVGSLSFLKGFGLLSAIFCGHVAHLGSTCGVAGDADLGLIDIVESVGTRHVIDGWLDAGVVAVGRLRGRFALIVRIDDEGDVSTASEFQGVGDLGLLGALESWCHDNERGFARCCCGVGSEEVGASYSSVLARDFEPLDGDVAASGLDEACSNRSCQDEQEADEDVYCRSGSSQPGC